MSTNVVLSNNTGFSTNASNWDPPSGSWSINPLDPYGTGGTSISPTWSYGTSTDRRSYLRLLPRGDVDEPEFCTRCGEELEAARPWAEEEIYDPYTGHKANVKLCPMFPSLPSDHDAWIVPE